MPTPLLLTKLHIPRPRREWVLRPRLVERLNAGLQCKLTLVSAPAGFGKTTLLSEWITLQKKADRQTGGQEAISPSHPPVSVAWLSLDRTDNDPARFWRYFIAAIQTVHQGVGQTALATLHSPQPPPIEMILTTLINEVAVTYSEEHHLVLVLDDYHLIEAPPLHEALAFFLEHMPPRMHLTIAGRADPPLPLPRLRSRGQLNELRAADLRFTLDETAAFLNETMGLDLMSDAVAALEARTEGWIAGLQLAALSIQGQDPGRIASLITAVSGSHRYILDYLTTEVLHRQPEDVQSFLLRTAILDRLSGPLCDAVIGSTSPQAEGAGQRMLEQLERANLFIIPLDEERCWYRYHRLFADLLRSRLGQTHPEQVPILHRRSSVWYEENGPLAEAVGHALAAGDIDRVVRLVEKNALALLDHGELFTVLGWLEALPAEVIRVRPWLSVARAWALLYAGQLDVLDTVLRDAEAALASGQGAEEAPEPLTLGDIEDVAAREQGARQISGHIAAIRAYQEGLRGNPAGGVVEARRALERLSKEDLMARGFAAGILGSSLRRSGHLAAAAEAFIQAIAIGQETGNQHVSMLARCNLAGLQTAQGRLQAAAETLHRALEVPGEDAGIRLPVLGLVYSCLSRAYYEWNDLETALHYAQEGLELSRQWGQAEFLLTAHVRLARVLRAMGDREGALEELHKAAQVASGMSSWSVVVVEADQARLQLLVGDVAAASRWAGESGLSSRDEIDYPHKDVYCILARVHIAEGRFGEAQELLVRLLEIAEAAGAEGDIIEILILQALALQARGMVDQALAALERALVLAEPERYVRTFISEGAPMGELLRLAASRGMATAYVNRLLRALDGEVEAPHAQPRPSVPPAPLVEPLSGREMEVLRLLAIGLSNKEIAQALVIAIGTVKNHLKSIYGKLGVGSRTQAVAQARHLGLL